MRDGKIRQKKGNMKTNSPQVLIDAANSPVQELPPVAHRPDKVHVARPWGFKGTQTLALPSKPRLPPSTPQNWRFLKLVQRGDGYTLLYFATNGALLKADLRILGIPTGTETYGLPREEALALGERIEKAFERLDGRK